MLRLPTVIWKPNPCGSLEVLNPVGVPLKLLLMTDGTVPATVTVPWKLPSSNLS
ncbi:MAG TPA: hypothetical protein PKE69_11015 [Pyrinomonadaceae bacterium]|nr:hypothetical protein [Pyrinomonadaceae bacterium]